MAFFEDGRGTIYPISRIRSIRPRYVAQGEKKPYYDHFATLDADETVEMAETDVDMIRRLAAGPAIPAAVGTYLLTNYGREGDTTFKDVVIAWRPTAYGNLEPVTTDFDQSPMTAVNAVLHPDGTVADFFGATWASPDLWEQTRRSEQAAVDEADAKRAAI